MAKDPRSEAENAEEEIDYTYDTVYLFTWNPSDKFFHDRDNYKLKWDTMLVRVLKHLNRCMSKFCVVPEVSDAGRLHVHGWFVLGDKVKWNKSVRPLIQHNGMFKMNRLRHVHGFNYYKKDMNSLQEYLPGRICVITKDNLRHALKECELRIIGKNCHLRKRIVEYYLNKCQQSDSDEDVIEDDVFDVTDIDRSLFLNVDY